MHRSVVICLSCVVLLFCLSAVVIAQPSPPPNYVVSSGSGIQNEEQVWFDPTDSTKLIAVWRDFRLGYRQIGIGYLPIAGQYDLWFDSLINPNMQYFGLQSWQSDPTLTVDANGNFYISVLDFVPTSNNDSSVISFYKSTDQGASWIGPVIVPDTVGPWFEDKQFITADRTSSPHSGNVYVAWARFPNPVRMQFARSIDGAATFEDTINYAPPKDIPECGYTGLGGQFAFPVVDASGDVYVFWNNYIADAACNLYWAISYVKSTDGGVSFGPEVNVTRTVGNFSQIDGGVDVYNGPVLDGDITGGPFDGNLYLCYANIDTLSPNFDWNIEFMRSTDGGATWSEMQYINDDDNDVYDQFHPWMIVNREGLLACIWYDQRTDPSHTTFDVFAAYSFDGGETWTTNHRISEQSVDPALLVSPKKTVAPVISPTVSLDATTLQPQAGLIAEYIGLTSYRDLHHAVWTGNGFDGQDVYGANWETPLMPPRLISPINGDTVEVPNPQLKWASAWKTDDDRYNVEAYTLTAPATTDNVSPVDTNFYDLTSLSPGTYYWRVSAVRISDAATTAFSPTDSFVVVEPGCCIDDRGDIDGNGTDADPLDLAYVVDYLFAGGVEPQCDAEADVNGDGFAGDPTDLAYLVDFLFAGGPAPVGCE